VAPPISEYGTHRHRAPLLNLSPRAWALHTAAIGTRPLPAMVDAYQCKGFSRHASHAIASARRGRRGRSGLPHRVAAPLRDRARGKCVLYKTFRRGLTLVKPAPARAAPGASRCADPLLASARQVNRHRQGKRAIPHPCASWTFRMGRRGMAGFELRGKISGSLDASKNFEGKRTRLASDEWAGTREVGSRACRNRRDFDTMQTQRQKSTTARIHEGALASVESWVVCHMGIARQAPRNFRDPDEAQRPDPSRSGAAHRPLQQRGRMTGTSPAAPPRRAGSSRRSASLSVAAAARCGAPPVGGDAACVAGTGRASARGASNFVAPDSRASVCLAAKPAPGCEVAARCRRFLARPGPDHAMLRSARGLAVRRAGGVHG